MNSDLRIGTFRRSRLQRSPPKASAPCPRRAVADSSRCVDEQISERAASRAQLRLGNDPGPSLQVAPRPVAPTAARRISHQRAYLKPEQCGLQGSAPDRANTCGRGGNQRGSRVGTFLQRRPFATVTPGAPVSAWIGTQRAGRAAEAPPAAHPRDMPQSANAQCSHDGRERITVNFAGAAPRRLLSREPSEVRSLEQPWGMSPQAGCWPKGLYAHCSAAEAGSLPKSPRRLCAAPERVAWQDPQTRLPTPHRMCRDPTLQRRNHVSYSAPVEHFE